MITLDQFSACIPRNKEPEVWYIPVMEITQRYNINNTLRLASFISQCAHESADFTTLSENLNYSWTSLRRVFGKYFPTDNLAKAYHRDKVAIASRVYADRMGNGPEASQDGWTYRGRGLIQLTGKANYLQFASHVSLSLEDTISFLETPNGAVTSACWFWSERSINMLADVEDIVRITKRINGGTNGLEDRIEKYNKIKIILS